LIQNFTISLNLSTTSCKKTFLSFQYNAKVLIRKLTLTTRCTVFTLLSSITSQQSWTQPPRIFLSSSVCVWGQGFMPHQLGSISFFYHSIHTPSFLLYSEDVFSYSNLLKILFYHFYIY
jgi:hypothetical protein